MSRCQWFRSAIRPLSLATAVWFLVLGSSVGPTTAQAAQPTCIEQIPSGNLDHAGIEGGHTLVQGGGSGGTGKMPGGSGGTGKMPGGSGGTGIIGTITAFGSVCVNGLEVDFDSSTTLSHNGVRTHLRDLALGQIIAIAANGPESRLAARHILILDALQGPVTRLDPHQKMLYVMDQPVLINEATRPNGPITLGALKLNSLVRVSGFRDASGLIHASRLEPVSYLKEHSAVGTLQRTTSNSWSLSGLALEVTNHRLPVSAGEKTLVQGRWDGRQLVVREIEIDSLPSLLEGDSRIIAEGLVLEHQNPLKLRISNFDVELTPQTEVADTDANRLLAKGQRVLVSGHLVGKNRIVADTIKGSVNTGSRGSPVSNQHFSSTATRSTPRDVGQPDGLHDSSATPDGQEQTTSSSHNETAGQVAAPNKNATTQQGESGANQPTSAGSKKDSSAGNRGPSGFGGNGRQGGGGGVGGGVGGGGGRGGASRGR